MRRLFDFEMRWLLAVFAAVLPSGASERLPEGARDVGLDGFVRDLVAHAPLQMIFGMRVCLFVLMVCPVATIGRFRTFMGLDDEDKLAVFEKLGRSPIYVIREIPLLFKMLACLGYGGLPEIQERLAIAPRDSSPPSWVGR